jgi:hypothetical protein
MGAGIEHVTLHRMEFAGILELAADLARLDDPPFRGSGMHMAEGGPGIERLLAGRRRPPGDGGALVLGRIGIADQRIDEDVIVHHPRPGRHAFGDAVVESVVMQRVDAGIRLRLMREAHLHHLAAAAGFRLRPVGGISGLVVGGVDLHPQRVLGSSHVIGIDGGFHDVDHRAACRGDRLLAFDVKVHFTRDHDKDRGRVGMDARRELRARRG